MDDLDYFVEDDEYEYFEDKMERFDRNFKTLDKKAAWNRDEIARLREELRQFADQISRKLSDEVVYASNAIADLRNTANVLKERLNAVEMQNCLKTTTERHHYLPFHHYCKQMPKGVHVNAEMICEGGFCRNKFFFFIHNDDASRVRVYFCPFCGQQLE